MLGSSQVKLVVFISSCFQEFVGTYGLKSHYGDMLVPMKKINKCGVEEIQCVDK